MRDYTYLDEAHTMLQYDSTMGEVRELETIRRTLRGKSIEEQRKYFFSSWWAPRFSTQYYPLYESKDAAVVWDGIIVGIESGGIVMLAGTGVTTDERSDNNGAGYKEYSEHRHAYFTTIPLDITACHYSDGVNDPEFFGAHHHVREVIIDDSVTYINTIELRYPVRYLGSLFHWLQLDGFKSYLQGEVHFYLEGADTETKRLVIPEGETELVANAFHNCVGLEEVVLPASLREIGDSAFKGCTGLRSIVIPDGVNAIWRNAFCDCDHLAYLTLPNGPFSVGDGAFFGCTALREVTIPAACKELRSRVFGACSEDLLIRCAAPKDYADQHWSRTWQQRDNDLNGCYDHRVEWI